MTLKFRETGSYRSNGRLRVALNIYSLERIEGYVVIEQEEKPSERGVPPAYWPADGSLHVENLSARYSADGPKVLHGISFDVKSGERVGIVGRTGSGKVSSSSRLQTTCCSSRTEFTHSCAPTMHIHRRHRHLCWQRYQPDQSGCPSHQPYDHSANGTIQ